MRPERRMSDEKSHPSKDSQHLFDENQSIDDSQQHDTEQQYTTPIRDHNVSVDAEGNTYPEGGLEAWLVVAGGFCGEMACFGVINTAATYQAYMATHQLSSYSDSSIGWIFSIWIFLAFIPGIVIGPLFDKYGPVLLVIFGSICTLLSLFVLSVCTQYWHFIIAFGVLGGAGNAFIFTPAVSAVGHFFLKGRGNATGIATCGGAFGGVVFPLMLQSLFPKVGWAWAIRTQGFISVILLLIACLLIRSRLPPRPDAKVLPDVRLFRDPAFALVTAGAYFLEWGLFVPITYVTSQALHTNGAVSFTLAYQILAIFNAGSVLGRWAPGYIADKLGRFNTQIAAVFLSAAASLGLWVPASVLAGNGSNQTVLGLTLSFAILMGFASGSNISLTPVCVGMLCPTKEYGRYLATAFTVVSLGSLTGLPIAGALISACGGSYWGVALFTGLCYVSGFCCFAAVRVMRGRAVS